MAVMGLGHFGYFVKDIEVMKDFWGNFMGMTLTKSSEGAAFYSADPAGVDHEIAIMQGRPEADDAHLIQQISLRVASLDDVRDFKCRAIAKGYEIDRLVTHASAIGLVTVQVVITGITLQLATSERLREAETEPRHRVGPRHTPR